MIMLIVRDCLEYRVRYELAFGHPMPAKEHMPS